VCHSQLNFPDPVVEVGKGMGLDGRVCKLIQEHVNDENYPPLFQLYVVWYIAFSLAVEIKCDLQVAPARNVSVLPREPWVAHFSECDLARATYARPVFFRDMGESLCAISPSRLS
jgi:hypothetical protein